jgi:threonine synthase
MQDHSYGSHAMKRCTCCGRFLPKSWSHETLDDEDDKRRYTRVIWYVLCICGTMNTEDA